MLFPVRVEFLGIVATQTQGAGQGELKVKLKRPRVSISNNKDDYLWGAPLQEPDQRSKTKKPVAQVGDGNKLESLTGSHWDSRGDLQLLDLSATKCPEVMLAVHWKNNTAISTNVILYYAACSQRSLQLCLWKVMVK
ncbi:hypothetical protein Y1Q_0022102 [Alligator mississippiensis]|uniref:Uncharacterized protein n=1 Tax=Alligator mississippiensis TaxID=8496 RepID=A0A151M4M4_ALLMI|nr:hypothetical protein Y1Q_0022102 [Alligator mississippiensis]